MIAFQEGISLLAPLGPSAEGLITSIILFSFTESWGGEVEMVGGVEEEAAAGEI